jgi:peptidase M1-like protein
LNRIATRSNTFAILAFTFILSGATCTVPLAPGYRILKESREVKFVPGQPPELQVRANFSLENNGNGDLTFIDAVFPDEKAFGRKNLRAQVSGRDAPLSNLPEEFQYGSPHTLRIPLDHPWAHKERRELVIEYSLNSPGDSGPRITLGDANFHLGYRGWFPVLQPPKHALSPFPKRPDKTIVTISVPDNFLVLSRGKPVGRKQSAGEIEHRFLVRQADLAPFVVAGRYSASPSKMFWTLQPLNGDPAPAEARINALWSAMQSDFGPLDKNILGPHIVESPELRSHFADEEPAAAAPFPGGALVNSQALALGVDSDAFLEIVAHALAHDWFGEELYFASEAALGLGEGLPDYATIVIDEARAGPSARRQRILKFLHEYDEASRQAVESPLGVTKITDPAPQRRIARAKAPLVFVALEDSYGEAPIREGLKNLVILLHGQEASYDEVRAALEQSTGKNLAEPFRVWLYDKGIPQDFRARYESAIESHP